MPHDLSKQPAVERTAEDLVFVGFNSRVFALDRYTGEEVWKWKSPEGTASYVGLLLDGDRLIVSVQGYTYCLDPLFGQQVWANPLKGEGTGIPSMTSARAAHGAVAGAAAAAAAAQAESQRQQQSAAAATTIH